VSEGDRLRGFFAIPLDNTANTVYIVVKGAGNRRSAMKRATFQIPKVDNEGRKFPRAVVLGIRREILERFEGFTVRETKGGWIGKDGKTYIDDNWEYTVVMEDSKIGSLVAWLKKVREILRQKAMWLEISEAEGIEIK